MPVHVWPRVDDGIFHSFHGTWIGELTKALNDGLLPADYYALGDVYVLSDVATAPPRISLMRHTESDTYALKQRTLVIRHSSNHRIIALLEILSPGNKSSRHAVRAFLDKAVAAMSLGIHLLVIDLFPPGPHDPHGMHGAIWDRLTGDAYEQPDDKPLTLAAYVAGPVKTGYVEPIHVGQALPDMPLFLTDEEYVNVPLEATYLAAWSGVPRLYRNILEK